MVFVGWEGVVLVVVVVVGVGDFFVCILCVGLLLFVWVLKLVRCVMFVVM